MNQRYKNNERIFDAVLSEALLEFAKNELNELEESPCEHTFSPGFDKKIARLAKSISAKKRAKAVLKGTLRAAVSVASVMGIVFMVLMTQPKVYAAVLDVVRIPIEGGFDQLNFHADSATSVFNPYIRLGYVPEGYSLMNIAYGGAAAYLSYENEFEEKLSFDYFLAGTGNMIVDNERHELIEFEKNGQAYYFYEALDEGDFSVLVWRREGYVFSIDAYFDEDEIGKIAENIVFQKVVEE